MGKALFPQPGDPALGMRLGSIHVIVGHSVCWNAVRDGMQHVMGCIT